MHDSVPYVQENMMKFFDQKGRIRLAPGPHRADCPGGGNEAF